MKAVSYTAAPTIREFHNSEAFVRGILGPIGSGKSVGCCLEIFKKATEQLPFLGVRKSRWVVIRNTYRELIDTTIKTWNDWFPRDMGTWSAMNMSHQLRFALEDRTIVELEVIFRALDKPSDIKKLLSLELTGGWINEAKEIPRQILDMLQGRVGRYPAKRDGGPSWWGVIMDTNPPDTDSWWFKTFEETKPSNYALFHQPSGKSPTAENVDNLPPKYYDNMMPGKDREWIDVFVHGKYGFITEGRPVYPEYNDDIHFSHHVLSPQENQTLHVGIDFGLTPAATIAQKINGQWLFLDEIAANDMGALQFGEILGQHLREHYRGFSLVITGDPAGEQRAQTDARTPFEILSALRIEADPAHTNDFTVRRETFAKHLTRMTFHGEPGLIIGPNCKMLRRGLAGGYKLKRLQVSGEERYREVPDKNIYSHTCESAQYLLLGAGEDDALLGTHDQNWNLDYSDLEKAAV